MASLRYAPVMRFARSLAAPLLDYALPPRCACCGTIVDAVESFCVDCWQAIDFLGGSLCDLCGKPIESALPGPVRCAPCLSSPPPFERVRAATAFDEVTRTVAHRLKYGRRTMHARLMARHMARLLPEETRGAVLVPVPLHRWRLWTRGFNQAVLIARELSRLCEARLLPDALVRTVNTPPLHRLGRKARARAVGHAFALAPGAAERIAGASVILIDDIWTTGATASACARVLRRAGAARVELICWARVTVDAAGD